MEINKRAVAALQSEDELESLIRDYRPFIVSCVDKALGKHHTLREDAISVAMIAFEESVKRYKPALGNFLMFSGNVIRCRLVDFMRKNKRRVHLVPLNNYLQECSANASISMPQDVQSAYNNPLQLEIAELTKAIHSMGFSFTDVVKSSPRTTKTRIACKKVAKIFAGNEALYLTFKKAKLLPLQQLENASGVSKKTIARHRNYIICLAEILSGEYFYLAEYAKPHEEGEQK
ncbi:MAG: sigma factor [Bacillota bacterium]